MLLTDLSPSGETRMLAAGLTRTGASSIRSAPRGAYSLGDLAGASDAVLVFDERITGEIDESIAALWEEFPAGESAFIALVPRQPAPRIDAFYCDPISSFLCSSEIMARLVELGIDCWAKTLCFAALRAIAEGSIEVDRLLVRQIPFRQPREHGRDDAAKALLLPHRGDPAYLRTALQYIEKSAGNSLTVRVGLDIEDRADYAAFPDDHPRVEFFDFSPAPVGPYVIRQELAERSPEPLLTLQDSDDLSCYDRFSALGDALAETGDGVVGSQELCLDEIRGLVQPVRYPLDGSAALAICANHALLHATLMTHRSAFFNAGGLSTNLIIASDTQFLLRAYFSGSIRNVDEFLYIRRRHAASLTNAPETIYDNPLRRRLSGEWTDDFNAIKRGDLKMENSSLRPMRRTDPWTVERFTARPKPCGATA
jgi:hypothetical protein